MRENTELQLHIQIYNFSAHVPSRKLYRIASSPTTLNIDSTKVLADGNLLIFRPSDFRRRNANTGAVYCAATAREKYAKKYRVDHYCHDYCLAVPHFTQDVLKLDL